ncbi:hypothetical protein LHYA1_G005293 [Lachnellula hyalina]|uniref:F-box domain-containing protein n=1 Tax=Lachnellula hyalina TaxID=1316788 RepID=A0A8H8R2H5_9HELO|nr:uncharacterized protein LHYA1_G005293 [Lachnellula hyalina]TVY27158.1 hypothetical protein LHYA1_G005293 [Lachnellula hyalina]
MDPTGSSTSCEGNIPTLDIPMDNNHTYLHGRLDPGRDESLWGLESVEAREPERELPRVDDNSLLSTQNGKLSRETIQLCPLIDAPLPAKPHQSYLVALPSELIDHILGFLDPTELAIISSVCHILYAHAKSDINWYRHVQENVPGVQITSPSPCKSYRDLYVSHDPYWFLSKYKIWFCDYFLTGKIIIARYDPRRGCLEGYRLLAERPAPAFEPWEADDEVLIHSFTPKCRLHLDHPVVHLDARSSASQISSKSRSVHSSNVEITMQSNERNGVFSNFLLTRAVQVRPNMQLWPPPNIPARQRVRTASQEAFVGSGHKPQKRSQVSTQAFRIRRWMEMTSQNGPGVHLGEEVYTYATLDPKVYTPTEEKPYRGIWVGDFSGHGCEFLLINQPDDEPFDEASVVQAEDETVEEWEARKVEERIYRGSLEAIKLTGDPNVPRGEYTFISDDIGKDGFIRTATEARFNGARIVKSRGHVAARMFRDDKYIESQLIMISHNRLAQYWVEFGHISFFERVDIDQFLSPSNNPVNETS